MQAQTEPKLHPETANLEVEQVVTAICKLEGWFAG